MSLNVLVTGGAGYIGSHIVKALFQRNHKVFTLDNLSTGYKKQILHGDFCLGDIRDLALLSNIIQGYNIQAVMHLAAKTSVPESIQKPFEYYENNTTGTLNLLQACIENGVQHFIFSSTAAVYGHPSTPRIDEGSSTLPTNPYGHSKLMAEQIIQDFAKAHDLNYIILRYFNVAGADPEGELGPCSDKAEHLIKIALDALQGKRSHLPIFGADYDTLDGTCVRDFIHVSDIANAHVKALEYLTQNQSSEILNCGYGQGYSVKQVIATLEKVSEQKLSTQDAPRRPGDVPEVIANNQKIRQILNWQPEYNDIKLMIQTAYEWALKLNQVKA